MSAGVHAGNRKKAQYTSEGNRAWWVVVHSEWVVAVGDISLKHTSRSAGKHAHTKVEDVLFCQSGHTRD